MRPQLQNTEELNVLELKLKEVNRKILEETLRETNNGNVAESQTARKEKEDLLRVLFVEKTKLMAIIKSL